MKYLQAMTREELGGSRMTGDVLATIASGDLANAHVNVLKSLRRRGLVVNGSLSEKGLKVRAKLKGLVT